MSATNVGHLKQSPKKRNLHQNLNDSKYDVSNSFLKILFWPDVSMDIIKVFFITDFLAESFKANKS